MQNRKDGMNKKTGVMKMGLLSSLFINDLFIKKVNEVIPMPTKEERDVDNFLNNNTIRSCEVECLYSQVRYDFKCAMQQGQIHRCTILKIRNYLENNVKYYNKTNFKNDAHAIYTMLQAKDITTNHLSEVGKMVKYKIG